MSYIKSPLNWVGNKYKYLDSINELVKGKAYNKIIDIFMGSGNILLNINADAGEFIGNDKTKLVPILYSTIDEINTIYTVKRFNEILEDWNRFRLKEDYYSFRDYWNEKYLSDKFDKDFIYETVMLTKMCSNSMIRFNPKKGYFNQGFRGLGKTKIESGNGFFTGNMIEQSVERLNELKEKLAERNFIFLNEDFRDLNLSLSNNDLLILDPPYILRADMYDTDFSIEHDRHLLEMLQNTNADFIYFNYLSRGDVENIELKEFLKQNNFKIVHINNKTLSGQGRSANIREVEEVIITNIE